MVIKKCIECNNNFISKPSAKRRFCSRFCYGKQVSNRQKGDNNPNYQRGFLQKGKKNHSFKHGLAKTNIYNTWRSMLKRCNDKNHKSYKRYGGRGIIILWNSFEEFRDDMYESYLKHQKENKNTTIERINNNGNYCKKNCRWATPKEQARNRVGNKLISFRGKTKTGAEWAEELGFDRHVIYFRIKKWGIEKALTKPLCIKKVTLEQLLKESDIISIHIPLSGNEGFFTKDMFKQMKQSAFLINTSRDAVIEKGALLFTLEYNIIAGAAVDFIDDEELLNYSKTHANLILTPHLGGATVEDMSLTKEFIRRKMKKYLNENM